MKTQFACLGQVCLLAFTALAVLVVPSPLHAAWTTFSLPSLPQDFASYQSANLPDGQLVFGTSNTLSLQPTFGSPTLSPFTHAQAWDPSSVAVESNSLGAVGGGTFAPSSIYTFNPSDASSSFTAIPGLSIQNYGIVFHDSSSLLVVGQNGSQSTSSGPMSSVSYVTLNGATNKVIIDNVSTFSGGIALDLHGDLYVTDDDNLKLYEFTPQQLSGAISGAPLSITDGVYVTTLPADGSIAVDSLGRIWSTGFQIDGLDIYDPSNGSTTAVIPALDNDNYVVSTFSDGTNNYVGYLNADGFSTGSALTYGYAPTATLVPEPNASLLLAAAFCAIALRRRRNAARYLVPKVLLVSCSVYSIGSPKATAGPYAPAAGQLGSTAISASSPLFINWATGVVEFTPGPQDISDPTSPLVSFGVPENALGTSDATVSNPMPVVSLGDGSHITLSFAEPITNGPGPDLAVFENGFADNFLELAFVEVSSDGTNFFAFPSSSLTQTATQVGPFGTLDPTNIDGLAGKYRAGFGTPFDLSVLSGVSPLLNIDDITEVRIVDVVGSIDPAYGTRDSAGNLINDPWPTDFPSSGFDLDAIGVINQIPEPATPALLTLSSLLLLRRRRHRARSTGPPAEYLPLPLPALRPNAASAFTLVELLTTITIIAVLAALLFKASIAAQQASQSTQCIANLNQLVLANAAYAADHEGRYAPAQEPTNLIRWHGARGGIGLAFDPTKGFLSPYLGREGRVKICPAMQNVLGTAESFEDGSGGYGYNEVYIGGTPADIWTGQRTSNIPHSSHTIMFSDTAFARADGIQEYPFCEPFQYIDQNGKLTGALSASMHFRHNGYAHVAWCDGHITSEPYTVLDSVNFYGGNAQKWLIGWIGPSDYNGYWNPENDFP